VQFYSCTAIMFSILNMFSCAMSLPPILTPDWSLYLMCFVVAPLAISLVRVESDQNIMNRACGKKSMTKIDFNTFLFILWCYGAKYLISIIILITIYLFTVDHIVFDLVAASEENFDFDMPLARHFILFGVVLHLIVISSFFVHRDYSIWNKNPLSNRCWLFTSLFM
jgi:magnesium-transporting ATPase (P-type)